MMTVILHKYSNTEGPWRALPLEPHWSFLPGPIRALRRTPGPHLLMVSCIPLTSDCLQSMCISKVMHIQFLNSDPNELYSFCYRQISLPQYKINGHADVWWKMYCLCDFLPWPPYDLTGHIISATHQVCQRPTVLDMYFLRFCYICLMTFWSNEL